MKSPLIALSVFLLATLSYGATINTSRSNIKSQIAFGAGKWCYSSYEQSSSAGATLYVEARPIGDDGDCDDTSEYRNDPYSETAMRLRESLPAQTAQNETIRLNSVAPESSLNLLARALSESSLPLSKRAQGSFTVSSREAGKKLYVGNLPFSSTEQSLMLLDIPPALQALADEALRAKSQVVFVLRAPLTGERTIVAGIRKPN